MTAAPIWPGVAEYLYHAALLALVPIGGTLMLPSAFTPRCRSFEWTPIAGISTDTGSERRSDGPLAVAGPMAPAAPAAGAGACCWASIAAPMVTAPPTSSRVPAMPATRMRKLLGSTDLGAKSLSGYAPPCAQGPPFPACLPQRVLLA